MGVKLSTREARKKLTRPADDKSRIRPYWVHYRHGIAVGYRPATQSGSPGHWLIREYRAGRGRYVMRTIGPADDLQPSDEVTVLSWEDVLKIAGGTERPTVTARGKHTVSDAWTAYCDTRKSPVDDRERATWNTFIEPKLGAREVSELTTLELDRWLVSQAAARGRRGQSKDGDDKDRLRRAQYTANRRFTLLRAVLNYAFDSDTVHDDKAWRRVKPFPNVDRPRTVTVSAEQARSLLDVLEAPLLPLAQASLYTGLRPGEVYGLRTDDVEDGRLRVRHGKGGKYRYIPLNNEGAAFFRDVADSRGQGVLFDPVDKNDVSRGMKRASKRAGISPRVTMYDMRRSYGSLMLNAGAKLEVIQEVLGHADMRMTRRTYAHLLQDTVAKSVKKHLPSFKRGKS